MVAGIPQPDSECHCRQTGSGAKGLSDMAPAVGPPPRFVQVVPVFRATYLVELIEALYGSVHERDRMDVHSPPAGCADVGEIR